MKKVLGIMIILILLCLIVCGGYYFYNSYKFDDLGLEKIEMGVKSLELSDSIIEVGKLKFRIKNIEFEKQEDGNNKFVLDYMIEDKDGKSILESSYDYIIYDRFNNIIGTSIIYAKENGEVKLAKNQERNNKILFSFIRDKFNSNDRTIWDNKIIGSIGGIVNIQDENNTSVYRIESNNISNDYELSYPLHLEIYNFECYVEGEGSKDLSNYILDFDIKY